MIYRFGENIIMKVYCPNCGTINTDDVEVIDCEEDIMGRDLVTFICICGEEQKSNVWSTF